MGNSFASPAPLEGLGPELEVRGGLNPLLMDHVLSMIFSNLQKRDLLSCRRISRTWYPLATAESKKGHRPSATLHNDSEVHRFTKILENAEILPLTSFVFSHTFTLTRHNRVIPTPTPEVIVDFLERWGELIQHLTFHCPQLPSKPPNEWGSSAFKYDEEYCESHLNFPNLRTLEFNVTSWDGGVKHWNVLSIFKTLVNKAPNLVDLKIRILIEGGWRMLLMNDIHGGIYRGIISSLPRSLKRLELRSCEIHEVYFLLLLNTLRIRNIALEELILYQTDPLMNVTEDTLTSLIESQRESLIEFNINTSIFTGNLGAGALLPPVFPKLERLRTTGTEDEFEIIFLDSFPALKVLDLIKMGQKEDQLSTLLQNIPPLEKLGISFPTPTIFNVYAGLFPNLKSLLFNGCVINREGKIRMGNVFTKLPQLEEFYIDFVEDSDDDDTTVDSILTGISETECKIMGNFDTGVEGYVAAGAGLLNLTNLKKLLINVRQPTEGGGRGYFPSYKNPTFTDITGRLALLKMPKLRKCAIRGASMTPACLGLLKDKMDFYINDGTNKWHFFCPGHFLGMCRKKHCDCHPGGYFF